MTVNKFDDLRSDENRALQVYLVLIGAAHNRQILTYKVLADKLGFKGAGVFNKILGHIMYWCQENDLPALTALVVNQETGMPGDGLLSVSDANSAREKVYQRNWYEIVPPSVDDLEAAYERGDAARVRS